jgi:hypothetical protein
MFCNQHHLNHLGNKLWARVFQTSLINLLCYPHLLSLSLVINVADIYRPHIVISWCDLNSMRTWSPFSPFPQLLHIQSIHAFIILISSYSNGFYHQPQVSLVWLLFVTSDRWFASLPLRVFRPNLGTRFFLGGGGCDSSCIWDVRHIFC